MSGSHYVFPEIKLLFPKQNYNVLSRSSNTHISVRDLYISRIGLPITYSRHMNVEIGTEATQFPEKEYINGIFLEVWMEARNKKGKTTRLFCYRIICFHDLFMLSLSCTCADSQIFPYSKIHSLFTITTTMGSCI
jgi:hypothetical protein